MSIFLLSLSCRLSFSSCVIFLVVVIFLVSLFCEYVVFPVSCVCFCSSFFSFVSTIFPVSVVFFVSIVFLVSIVFFASVICIFIRGSLSEVLPPRVILFQSDIFSLTGLAIFLASTGRLFPVLLCGSSPYFYDFSLQFSRNIFRCIAFVSY